VSLAIKRKYLILSSVTAGVVIFDQITKLMVIKDFRLGESISILSGYFNLTYIRNKGAAFGLLNDAPEWFRVPFFLVVPFVALFVIAYIFRKIPDKNIKISAALSLVIGGAIGNLIDRIRLGYVIDFLDFHWRYQYHFPAFNVADSAICVGVGILMLDLMFNKELEKADASTSV